MAFNPLNAARPSSTSFRFPAETKDRIKRLLASKPNYTATLVIMEALKLYEQAERELGKRKRKGT